MERIGRSIWRVVGKLSARMKRDVNKKARAETQAVAGVSQHPVARREGAARKIIEAAPKTGPPWRAVPGEKSPTLAPPHRSAVRFSTWPA